LERGVKSDDTGENTRGEGIYLGKTDTKARRCGEQTGFDTPVVHTVNDGCSKIDLFYFFSLHVKHPTWEVRSQD